MRYVSPFHDYRTRDCTSERSGQPEIHVHAFPLARKQFGVIIVIGERVGLLIGIVPLNARPHEPGGALAVHDSAAKLPAWSLTVAWISG